MLKSTKAKVILIGLLLFVAVLAPSILKSIFQYAVRIDCDGTNIIFSPAPFIELIGYEEKLISGPKGLPLRYISGTMYEFNVVSSGMQTLTIHYQNFWGKEEKEIFEFTVNSNNCMTFVERKDSTGIIQIDFYVFSPHFTESIREAGQPARPLFWYAEARLSSSKRRRPRFFLPFLSKFVILE